MIINNIIKKNVLLFVFIIVLSKVCYSGGKIENANTVNSIPDYYFSLTYINLVKEINFKNKGNSIFFGYYEQDNNIENGKEPIEWILLEKNTNERIATFVSKYILDCKPYSQSDTFSPWEFSYIRGWLNSEFLYNAFTEEERQIIYEGQVVNNPNIYNNIPSGYNTVDKLYLLSIEDIINYFVEIDGTLLQKKDFALKKNFLATSKGTEYAIANGLRVLNRPHDINHHNGNYFLRTFTGIENRIWYNEVYGTNYISYISEFGQISIDGTCVISCDDGIRPVMRIQY